MLYECFAAHQVRAWGLLLSHYQHTKDFHHLSSNVMGMMGLWHLQCQGARPMPAQTKRFRSVSIFAISLDVRNWKHSLVHLCSEQVVHAQVLEQGGLQMLLTLLPAPESSPAAADTASATPAASTTAAAAPSWANKPASHRFQASLLQLFAAIMQSQPARRLLLAADSNSNASNSRCVAVLLNILCPEAPAAPVAVSAALSAPAGGKGAAVNKADGKAKAAGKGKAEVPAGPPAELVPPFPMSVQLPAVQCMQVTHPSNRTAPACAHICVITMLAPGWNACSLVAGCQGKAIGCRYWTKGCFQAGPAACVVF